MLPATARCTRRACRGALKHSRHAYSAIVPRPQAVTSLLRERIHIPTVSRGYATTVKLSPQAGTAARPTPASTPTDLPPVQRTLPDLAKLETLVNQTRTRFLSAEGLPSTQLTAVALKTLSTAAAALKPYLKRKVTRPRPSTLLALDKDASQDETTKVFNTADKISKTALEIIFNPRVAIDQEVVARYVDVQCLLGRPASFPDVFDLLATKPWPKTSGGTIVYKKPYPWRPSAAVEANVAEKALNAAIAAKDLDVAIRIVEKTYKGTPFLLNKLRKTLTTPAIITAAVPIGIYTLSKQFASLHPSIDTAMATRITFAGVTAYVVFTAALGMFAKAFTMDHMVRVTWQLGTPIRERWMREQERASLDKIVLAWGFQEKWRWGEEVGSEWMALREYIGQRGMILDRFEFIEGMNP